MCALVLADAACAQLARDGMSPGNKFSPGNREGDAAAAPLPEPVNRRPKPTGPAPAWTPATTDTPAAAPSTAAGAGVWTMAGVAAVGMAIGFALSKAK